MAVLWKSSAGILGNGYQPLNGITEKYSFDL